MRIEDYALLSDTQSAALVSRDASIDWTCFPRFDSGACFARLVGTPENGRWQIAPRSGCRPLRRAYRPGTLVLDTDLAGDGGAIRVSDCMPPRGRAPDIVRVVEGLEGEVQVRMELVIRFDYGRVVPWVRTVDGALRVVAGPDALQLFGDVETHGEDLRTVAEFTLRKGERRSFVLTWYPSWESPPRRLDPVAELASTEEWWREWSSRCRYDGPWKEAVLTSLLVLKGLTYDPTGGIVAAPTTSLPEAMGGERNWDYRFCWLRDATLTLYALLLAGYRDEAAKWRDWLLRAVAGDVTQLQIMYGIAGERHLAERELSWLSGYGGSRPVRVGNAAAGQLQLDVAGEVMDALYQARRIGVPPDEWSWGLQQKLLEWLEGAWHEPDEGIWEVRGGRRHFTYSKVMAWVAFDRGVKTIEALSRDGPLQRYRAQRDAIHADVCARGWSAQKRAFTQSYGDEALDASALMIPIVGFLPVSDERVRSTVAAIERELLQDGFVLRYRTDTPSADGLSGREGAFLACSFWLADVYSLMGRVQEGRQLFERLLSVRNDLGLLSEEYDPIARRQLGNFPQAFSHLALVNTAFNLTSGQPSPAEHRQEEA